MLSKNHSHHIIPACKHTCSLSLSGLLAQRGSCSIASYGWLEITKEHRGNKRRHISIWASGISATPRGSTTSSKCRKALVLALSSPLGGKTLLAVRSSDLFFSASSLSGASSSTSTDNNGNNNGTSKCVRESGTNVCV